MHLRVLLTTLALSFTLTSCHRQPAADLISDAARTRVPISYTSDTLTITGLLSKPQGRGPFPLILVNHGGFDPAEKMASFLDLFAAAGYLALASDYRGCGKSQGQHEVAKGEVNDVLNAIRYAKTLPCVDPHRVHLFGFSHGGILSLLAASRDPSIQSVIVAQSPVEMAECHRHWVAHREDPGIQPLASLHLIVGGTPEEQPAAWRERSALYAAPQIHCPVLLIYSDSDAVIPTDQGPQMEKALRTSGNTHTRLIMLKNLNHGLTPAAWADLKPTLLDFLSQP